MTKIKGNFLVVILVFLTFFCDSGYSASLMREKHSGISDQRLAELETLIALSKMKGKLVTVPVAFGVIDPEKIGKRTRSSLPNPEEYESNEKLWLQRVPNYQEV